MGKCNTPLNWDFLFSGIKKVVKIYLEKKPINIFCNIDIYEVVEGLSSPCIICSSPFHRSIRVKGKGVYDCPRYKFQHTTFYDSSYCQRMCTSQIGHVKNGKKKKPRNVHIYPQIHRLFVCCFISHSRIFTPRRTLPYARHSWWGFFSVPHLPWHGSFVCNGHLRGPVTLAPVAKRLAVELSLIGSTTEPPRRWEEVEKTEMIIFIVTSYMRNKHWMI